MDTLVIKTMSAVAKYKSLKIKQGKSFFETDIEKLCHLFTYLTLKLPTLVSEQN